MQVNAIIKATASNGKAINTTISYLRQSQEDKAASLGAALNALTTNTLDSVQVNEIGVTDFTPPPSKLYPNPHLTATPVQGSTNTYNISLYSESTATPTLYGTFSSSGSTISTITLTAQGNNYWGIPSTLEIKKNSDLIAVIPENDNYYSASTSLHVS